MKYYLGIDIGKHTHVAALLTEQGDALGGARPFAATTAGWQEVCTYLASQGISNEYSAVHVGFEATGHYWLPLYEQCLKLGMRVSVLNPLEVKAFRNEGIRGNKTDSIDAVKIAKLLRFGDFHEAHVPSEDVVALKQLTRVRGDFVVMAGQVKQQAIAVIDQIFPEYEQLFSDMFGKTSQALLATAATPETIAALPLKKLTAILKQASRGRLGADKAGEIQQAAGRSMGRQRGLDAFTMSLEIFLSQLDHLEKQITHLDQEIVKRVAAFQTTLTTIPGIGTTIAGTIIAEVGSIERFQGKDGAEKLVALAGIDPKLKESGHYKGKTKMSKRGSRYLRHAIRQAAFVAVTTVKDPLFRGIYDKQLAKGKHKEVALSHVERKMVHVIYALLVSNKSYVPHI